MIVYTLLVVIVTLCTLSCIFSLRHNINNFKYEKPKQIFGELVQDLGYDFMLFTDKDGGIVRWEKPKFYESVMMLDECIEPFLYATIKVYIPDENIEEILKIDKSIYYDRLKHLLTTRANSMHGNVIKMIRCLAPIDLSLRLKKLESERVLQELIYLNKVKYYNKLASSSCK